MQVIDNTPHFWPILAQGKIGSAHKYDYGHTLIYAAWTGLGAAILASRAALLGGSGLVSVAVPDDACGHTILSSLPEVIIEPARRASTFTKLCASRKRNVALIGCGAGQGQPARIGAFLSVALANPNMRVVIDGDALTLLATDLRHLRPQLTPRVILTPHAGEFDRLYPQQADTKLQRTADAARALNAVIVHKGAETIIAHPDGRVVITPAASPWLATAGTGDVLAGLIAGLAAWRLPDADTDILGAAAAGVYLHGMAAHIAGAGLTAGRLCDALPAAWAQIVSVR